MTKNAGARSDVGLQIISDEKRAMPDVPRRIPGEPPATRGLASNGVEEMHYVRRHGQTRGGLKADFLAPLRVKRSFVRVPVMRPEYNFPEHPFSGSLVRQQNRKCRPQRFRPSDTMTSLLDYLQAPLRRVLHEYSSHPCHRSDLVLS